MTANEWAEIALALVKEAVAAAQGKDAARIVALEKKILTHQERIVPVVPSEVSNALSDAMDALHNAVVNITAASLTALEADLQKSAATIEAVTTQLKKKRKLISLEPVTQISATLGTIIDDIKKLRANPESADDVAKALDEIKTKLEQVIKEAQLGE